MCDHLITKDGAVIATPDQARAYGIPLPREADHMRGCLCGYYEVADYLDLTKWKRNHLIWTSIFAKWAEIGDDGKTWDEGYEEIETGEYTVELWRPDGRKRAPSE